MHVPGPVLLAALVTLTAATAVALAAEHPPREARLRWRFPAVVISVAVVNVGLTLIVYRRPDVLTGTILLASAVLLIYAAHRRARAVVRHPPSRPRRPSR